MRKLINNWKVSFEIDRMIYPNKNIYAWSWTLMIVGAIVGIVGAVKGNEGWLLIVLSFIIFFYSVVIDDYYAREYVRKNGIEKKAS